MAEKILQTRIVNKHTSYDIATTSSSFYPKEGEIVLAKVDTLAADGRLVPTYLMKVGAKDENGNLVALKDLKFLAAPASDVYEWAKASVKPAYGAGEIKRGTNSTVNADLEAIESAIEALQSAVGSEGSVAEMIEAAIAALDVEDTAVANQFVTAVAEADGKISVTRRALSADDIPELAQTKITGLTSDLASKADAETVANQFDAANAAIEKVAQDLADYETANDNALAGVKATAEAATTVDEATDIANTAVSTFKSTHFDDVASRLSTAEGKITANAQAIETEASRAAGVEGGLDNRLTTVEGKVNALSSATHFLGVKEKLEDVTKPAAGDIVIVGNKEYVYDTTKGWVELGDTTGELEAISDLEDAVDALDTRLQAAESEVAANGPIYTKIGEAQGAANNAQAYAEGVNTALESEVTRAKAAEAQAETNANSYTDGKITTVNNAIEALTATVGQNKTAAENATKQVADDLATEILRATAAEEAAAALGQKGIDDAAKVASDLVETNKAVAANDEAIEANSSAITTIQNNFAKVKATSDNKFELVVGAAEDVIIFDCGTVEADAE